MQKTGQDTLMSDSEKLKQPVQSGPLLLRQNLNRRWSRKTRKYPGFSKEQGNRGVQMSTGYPVRHWSVASSRTVLANRVLKVRQDTCVIPASGGALEYFVLELADWVNVVPVTSARELVMVRQYRHVTRGVTLEIPAVR